MFSVIFLQGVDFWAINTDSQALIQSAATHRIQIGEELTRGLGEVHNWNHCYLQKVGKKKTLLNSKAYFVDYTLYRYKASYLITWLHVNKYHKSKM